jgi:heat shock protein HslJ
MYRSVFVLLALIAVTAAACSDGATTPTSPSSNAGGTAALNASQISGTWRLASLQNAGESVQTTPAGAEYTLTLADNRAAAIADCNRCAGALAVSGQIITIGPLMACTRAACPTMAFGSSYEAILGGESTAVVEENVLMLHSSRGRLAFMR